MTQEDKELLLKDLCARLLYGVTLDIDTADWKAPQGHIKAKIEGFGILYKDMSLIVNGSYYGDNYRPYLRSMSSMTEEERKEYELLAFSLYCKTSTGFIHLEAAPLIDWLNRNHFDYRGLIEKGLAIKVTEENNPYKN